MSQHFPATISRFDAPADRAAELLREFVESGLERFDGRGDLCLTVVRRPAAEPAQQLERHEDAHAQCNCETYHCPVHRSIQPQSGSRVRKL